MLDIQFSLNFVDVVSVCTVLWLLHFYFKKLMPSKQQARESLQACQHSVCWIKAALASRWAVLSEISLCAKGRFEVTPLLWQSFPVQHSDCAFQPASLVL